MGKAVSCSQSVTHLVLSAWTEWVPTFALFLELLPLWLISWPPSLSMRHNDFLLPSHNLWLCISASAYHPVLTWLSGGQVSHLMCRPRTRLETDVEIESCRDKGVTGIHYRINLSLAYLKDLTVVSICEERTFGAEVRWAGSQSCRLLQILFGGTKH